MDKKLPTKKNNKEFTEKTQSEITDRMNRLMSVSDFISKECVNDAKFLGYFLNELTDSQRKKVGDLLATLGVTKLFLEIWKKYFKMDFLSNDNRLMKTLMQSILCVLCISMESSTTLCVQVFKSELHKVVLNYLKTDYLDPSKTVDPDYEDLDFNLLSILHNMLQKVQESRQSLREQEAFAVFHRFRKSPSKQIACMAIILQAYIITEEENELVNSDDSNFICLKDALERALMPANSQRRADGFLPIDVISALNRLAVNDNNKTRIVSVGLLPFYVKLLQPQCSEEEQKQPQCSEEEQKAAAKGLWTLAFKCTQEIENEPGCVPALKKMTEGKSERFKRLAAGVLWTLEESKRKKNSCQEDQGHVFISYQWDSKPMIKQLVRSLKKEGFQVWVDFDKMSGSILEAMANAVEEAAVVIICLSQKYKASPNCRTEAEYTFRLRKDILPLRLQSDYSPDGWLGAMIGNRLWHDFSSDDKYSESIKNVIRELGARGKATEYVVDEPDSNVDKVTKASVPTTGSSGGRTSNHATWTSEKIVSWLKDNKLEEFQEWFKDYDGTLLSEYKTMLENAPESFYSGLREKFSQINTLKLSKALKQL